jgi:hypothetical protein
MADMDAVFSNHDLVVNLLLYSILEDYRKRGPGCPQTHSPDEMAKKARTELRSLLVMLNATSRVNHIFHQATAPAVWALLEEVNRQFAQMRFNTLWFLLQQPHEYEGVRLPIVQRSDAIPVYPNLTEGRRALEVVRACFEEPFGTNPAPLLGHGCDLQRASFGRRCLTAGHWVRSWIHELLWITPPVEDVESLWMALHRGCSVCGNMCQCATRGAMLRHAATNADPLLPNNPTTPSSAPADSIYTRLHARIEVPWDLKPVNGVYMLHMTSGEPMSVNNDPIKALATRIWMYTHPDHIVTVQFHSNEAEFVVDETTTTPSTSIEAHMHMKLVLARMNNRVVNRTAPFARWLITRLANRRMDSIKTSGLRDNILKHGTNVHPQMVQSVFDWPDNFSASLPLFPAHGKHRTHSWMHVLGLTEHEFLDASWQSSLPLPPTARNLAETATVAEAEAWRSMALRRAIMALSEALPNRRTAFWRTVEFLHPLTWYDGPGRENPTREFPKIEVSDLAIMTFEPAEDCACADNWTLLETWESLKQLKDGIVDKGETFQNVLRMYQAPHEWHHQRLPADPMMIQHFSRLDSVLGMAWKHVARIEEESFHRHTSPSARQIELRDVAIAYLNGTREIDPPCPWTTPVFGSILPPAPRHPDVLMRWWLFALTNLSVTINRNGRRPEDLWPCAISLDLHNTFVCIDSQHARSCSNPRSCTALAVQLSLSTTTSILGRDEHLRITMGIRLPQLRLILAKLSWLELNDTVDEKLKCSLDQWHEEAARCCQVITKFAQKGHGRNALWLFSCILEASWTPVLEQSEFDVFKDSPHTWVTGWRALSTLCTSTSAWFCDTCRGPVPSCKRRGHTHCLCCKNCVF